MKSLKNFARLDEAEFQQSDIHEGIDSTLTLLNRELNEKVTVIRDYGKIPKIFIYAGELNQVFMNILRNAIQAIENKGTIKIRTFAHRRIVAKYILDGLSETFGAVNYKQQPLLVKESPLNQSLKELTAYFGVFCPEQQL